MTEALDPAGTAWYANCAQEFDRSELRQLNKSSLRLYCRDCEQKLEAIAARLRREKERKF